MTASTASGSDTNYNVYNLPLGHAYSMLGAYAIKDSNGAITNRLFRMRNPWGTDHAYNGTWNDQDTKSWTAAAKAQVPYVDADDGIFFVEDSDFVKIYAHFVIADVHDSWNNNIAEVVGDTIDGPQRSFTFTLNKDQEVYVGAEFYSSRMYASGCKSSTKGKLYLYQGSTKLNSVTV